MLTKNSEATISQADAKKAGVKAAGTIFRQERSPHYGGGFTGNLGLVLAELSPKGKLQAEMTCLKCDGTHVRESSDWHQSLFCRECKPTSAEKKAAAATPGAGNGGKGGRVVKLPDGSELREMTIREDDTEEMRQLKEDSNAVFAILWAKAQEEKEAEKAAKAKEAELAKLKANATKVEEARKALAEKLERVKAYALQAGLPVSPKTEKEGLDALKASIEEAEAGEVEAQ